MWHVQFKENSRLQNTDVNVSTRMWVVQYVVYWLSNEETLYCSVKHSHIITTYTMVRQFKLICASCVKDKEFVAKSVWILT